MSNGKTKKKGGGKALSTVRGYFPGVKRVEDARKPLMIEVTPEDNDTSEALDHTNCALAVACKRSLRADGVIVAVTTVYIIHGHTATRFKVNDSVAREIVSFDRHAKIELQNGRSVSFAPGRYVLNAPSEYQQLGRDSSSRTRPEPSGQHRVGFRHVTANIRTVLGTGGVALNPPDEA